MKYRKIFTRQTTHIPAGSAGARSSWRRVAPHIPAGSADARSSWRRLTALLLAAALLAPALLLTACGGASDGSAGGAFGSGVSAATMFLRKTEGTVAVTDAEGADIAPAENLGLYSGYTVGTGAGSCAWIDLDNVKLTKLDENSAAVITKDGKNLSIDVTSGNLFFNVTEPLADDETMEIRTSSMLVGIRGTCGWVTDSSAGLLEGAVSVVDGDQTVAVKAGEMAVLEGNGELKVMELAPDDVPAFVLEELLADNDLNQIVSDAVGLNIPAWSMAFYEELLRTEENVVYYELIDFEKDGSPELLVVHLDENNVRNSFHIEIYRNGSEGLRHLTGCAYSITTAVEQTACWLVESNGKRFVCSCVKVNSGSVDYLVDYTGSLAGRDGGPGDWGCVDSLIQSGGDSFNPEGGYVYASAHDERGFVITGDSSGKEMIDTTGTYTFVRELYSWSVDS